METEKKRTLATIVYDKEMRLLLQDFLNGEDFEVESAENGLEAFHSLAKKYFHLIITDFQMPGLGGVKLLARLKRIQPWARVIVIPTRRVKRSERKIIESEADACLEKPFEVDQLRGIIQRMFAKGGSELLPSEEGWKSSRLSMETG